MLIYVLAESVTQYHDYLQREQIHEDAARFIVGFGVLNTALQGGHRVVTLGYPDWYRQAA